MSGNLGRRVARSMVWSFGESFGAAALALATTMVLARLISPDDFGLIAVLEIFVMTGLLFVESGFTSALVRLKERTPEQERTVLVCNLATAFLLYVALFFCAPFIGELYRSPRLPEVARWFCLVLPLNALCVVQQARLTAELRFGSLFLCTGSAAVVSSAIAIVMAVKGLGVWALVAQQLTMWSVRCLMLWGLQWRHPVIPGFSRKAFGELFGFGWKLLVASIIDKVCLSLYTMIIGRWFSVYQAGLFSKSRSLAGLPAENATSALQRVSYPTLSRVTDEKERLHLSSRVLLEMSEWFVFPAMCLLAVMASQTIEVTLGSRWLPAAPYFAIICLGYALFPMHAINLNILNACGRSDLFLRLEMIKAPLTILLMAAGALLYGMTGLCISFVVNSVACLFINSHYSGRLASCPLREQIAALIPTLICSLAACAVAYPIGVAIINPWLSLLAGVSAGLAVYLVASRIFARRLLKEAVSTVKMIFQ